MTYSPLILTLLGIYFHIPVDFVLNVRFPHIFSVLHCNSIETSWFSLVIHESPLTEEKSMPSSLDSCILILPPRATSFTHSAFALPKKSDIQIQVKSLEFFKFALNLKFRCILTGPKGWAEAMRFSRIRPVQSDGVVWGLMHHFHLALGTGVQ